MPRYLALLRGINVGGNNVIPMAELRDCFECLKFQHVTTYIQSGNVIFNSRSSNLANLRSKIETALSKRFSYRAKVVVLSKQTYQESLKHAPKQWGKQEGYKHNALFAISDGEPEGFDFATMLRELPSLVKSIESASYSREVLFWSVNQDKASKSTMMKLAKSPAYQHVTVRNHKTFFKLFDMLD